jgi:hypothetical protein
MSAVNLMALLGIILLNFLNIVDVHVLSSTRDDHNEERIVMLRVPLSQHHSVENTINDKGEPTPARESNAPAWAHKITHADPAKLRFAIDNVLVDHPSIP